MNIKRYIEDVALSEAFSRQMRFIAGPRQSGKTTIAKNKLHSEKCEAFYYNWDRKEVRDRYRKETDFLKKDILERTHPSRKHFWVCHDEIHKMPKWKNILKDFFDTHEKKANFIIAGSARLDMFRKSGDSLAGRYFLFKLNPLILPELLGKKINTVLPEINAMDYIEKSIAHRRSEQKQLDAMLLLGSFPEPLLQGNDLFAKKWHSNYLDRIVKEDLRDLSSIHLLEKVIDLIYVLPTKIGSPLSIKALKEDLDLNFNTVKNYVNYLILTYVLFQIMPYNKSIKRAVKKEKKVYFYDYTTISNEAARFENFIALELKTRIDLWNDMLEDSYELFFIRMRDGKETDFLITKNAKPYLLCEIKLSSTSIDKHHYLHSKILGNIPFVQIIKTPDVLKIEQKRFFIVSASRFLS